jgi:hypothetical protein
MSEWRPLSMRQGQRPVPELREDFTPAATRALVYWLEGQYGYRSQPRANEALVISVALACDVEVRSDLYDPSPMRQLLNAAASSDEVMLDVLDATLYRGPAISSDTLRTVLVDAHSVWTVSQNNKSLERRVTTSAGDAVRSAAAPADDASTELLEAWAKAYGMKPDASDAWDHSIKAVEALLIPLVVPNKAKANLGDALGQMKANHERYTFGPVAEAEGVEKLLRLLWPNPDRHAGAERRIPTIEEARGIVHLAVAVVQWLRDGLIVKL